MDLDRLKDHFPVLAIRLHLLMLNVLALVGSYSSGCSLGRDMGGSFE